MRVASVLLIATVPQTTVTPSNTLICEQMLGNGKDEFSSLARLETDQDHHAVSSVLTIFGPGYTAEWNAVLHGQTVALATAGLNIEAWPLPKNTSFPIKVGVTINGMSAGRFTFDRANVSIGDMAQRTRPLTYFPAVQLPTSFKPQGLWGTAEIGLLTTDARGQMIARRVLKGPDWHVFSAFAKDAFTELEVKRGRKGCHPYYTVLVVD